MTHSAQKTLPPLVAEKPSRLISIDSLRGFDMLLISGGGTFLVLLENKTGLEWVDMLAAQMKHATWAGFTFYDFIFPLFLFVAGVSIPFSINKGLKNGNSKNSLYRKAFRRMLILIILGILYKNAPMPVFEPSQIRLGSVLGRIGIAGFVTTFLYLNYNMYSRIVWITGILFFYYLALFLIPVPGYGAGDLSIEGNLVGWFDRNFLPGRLHQKIFDENGLLTQLPALCLTVLGAMAGDILLSPFKDKKKLQLLLLFGFSCIVLGLLWSVHFPIIKRLWTSSFILLTGGMAFFFMALFYYVIDVLKYHKWAFFFKVIGVNSLTIYFAYHFIDFSRTAHLIFFGLYKPLPEPFHEVFQALGAVVLVWLFLYFLYKQRIFIKV